MGRYPVKSLRAASRRRKRKRLVHFPNLIPLAIGDAGVRPRCKSLRRTMSWCFTHAKPWKKSIWNTLAAPMYNSPNPSLPGETWTLQFGAVMRLAHARMFENDRPLSIRVQRGLIHIEGAQVPVLRLLASRSTLRLAIFLSEAVLLAQYSAEANAY